MNQSAVRKTFFTLSVGWSIALLAACTPSVLAQGNGALVFPDWVTERIAVSQDVNPGQAIAIRNPYGDVRCRKNYDSAIEVTTVVQQLDNDTGEPQVEVVERDGTLLVSLGFAETDDPPHAEVISKRRIDLVAFVPEGSTLSLTTDSGLIATKKVRNDVVATSQSGDIQISNLGDLSAQTEHGDIEVSFGHTDWKSPPNLSTLTGAIRVYLPAGPNASVNLTTHGLISTDFSLTFEPTQAGEPKAAKAVLGEGQQQLVLRSDRGAISLLREPGS